MTIANSLQLAHKEGEAKLYYEQVINLEPDNVVALNNLAWHIRAENPAKALEYARHANQLAPDSADVLDTLAVVEYANKDYKQAQRSVERALAQNPDNPSVQFHSAMISAAMGDSASAINTLEALRDSGADFPEKDQANQLLKTLKQ
jgi:tetratricopeptide (TPR) repeat protein